MKRYIYFFLLTLLLSSCASNPYRESEKSYRKQWRAFKKTIASRDTLFLENGIKSNWVSTINFNLRKPHYVIIHHTAQDSLKQTLKTFTLAKTQVSAHYVIGRNGEVVQMLSDYLRSWHAGVASWGKTSDINSASIGIELDNNGLEPFSELQMSSLLALLSHLKKQYNIPTQNFIGHSDIAPSRKSDPSAFFPWKVLAEKGFGTWTDENIEPAPLDFNPVFGLRIIGYDTRDFSAATKAFKLHYIQTEVTEELDQKTIDIIYNIFKKQ